MASATCRAPLSLANVHDLVLEMELAFEAGEGGGKKKT